MTWTRIALSAALLIFSGAEARAQACAKAVTQLDLDVCANQTFEMADHELNAAYKEILGRLKDDPPTSKLLVASEKAWLSFRDAACAFDASQSQGGSIYPMLISLCQAKLADARTKQLEGYLHCPEGDMNCPVPGKP